MIPAFGISVELAMLLVGILELGLSIKLHSLIDNYKRKTIHVEETIVFSGKVNAESIIVHYIC